MSQEIGDEPCVELRLQAAIDSENYDGVVILERVCEMYGQEADLAGRNGEKTLTLNCPLLSCTREVMVVVDEVGIDRVIDGENPTVCKKGNTYNRLN